jgi:hypothetical protein
MQEREVHVRKRRGISLRRSWIRSVAFPTKKTVSLPKSGFSFLLGKSKLFVSFRGSS